jgi:hypothetical protein
MSFTKPSPNWKSFRLTNIPPFIETASSLPCLQQHNSGPYPEPFPSNQHPQKITYILILSLHLRLRLATGLCVPQSPTTVLYAFILIPLRATCPVNLILLDLNIQTTSDEQHKSLTFFLHSFPPPSFYFLSHGYINQLTRHPTNALHYFSVYLSLHMFRHSLCHPQGCRREFTVFNASNSLSQHKFTIT